MIERRADPQHTLNAAGYAVAIVLCILLGFALFALVRFDVRPTNHDILLVVITFLTTKISTIVDFFYGGSAASKQQQSAIANLANTVNSAQAALSPTPDVTLKPGDTATVSAEQPKDYAP